VNGTGKEFTDEVLEVGMSLNHRRIAFTTRLLVIAIFIPLTACRKSDKPERPLISAFASPDDAGNALLAAAKSGDPNALLVIFGPDSKEVIYSGDAVHDKNAADAFVAPLARDAGWFPDPAGRS
jgi:hypothetical protein